MEGNNAVDITISFTQFQLISSKTVKDRMKIFISYTFSEAAMNEQIILKYKNLITLHFKLI